MKPYREALAVPEHMGDLAIVQQTKAGVCWLQVLTSCCRSEPSFDMNMGLWYCSSCLDAMKSQPIRNIDMYGPRFLVVPRISTKACKHWVGSWLGVEDRNVHIDLTYE